MTKEKAPAATEASVEGSQAMNASIVTQPDILSETLRVANAMYLALYGVTPYPPKGAK